MSANRTPQHNGVNSTGAIRLDHPRRPYLQIMAMVLLGLILASSLSACGKRGEPYRPSEVPDASSTS